MLSKGGGRGLNGVKVVIAWYWRQTARSHCKCTCRGPWAAPGVWAAARWIIPLGLALPYAWRLAQCIRVYRDTGARPQVPDASFGSPSSFCVDHAWPPCAGHTQKDHSHASCCCVNRVLWDAASCSPGVPVCQQPLQLCPCRMRSRTLALRSLVHGPAAVRGIP